MKNIAISQTQTQWHKSATIYTCIATTTLLNFEEDYRHYQVENRKIYYKREVTHISYLDTIWHRSPPLCMDTSYAATTFPLKLLMDGETLLAVLCLWLSCFHLKLKYKRIFKFWIQWKYKGNTKRSIPMHPPHLPWSWPSKSIRFVLSSCFTCQRLEYNKNTTYQVKVWHTHTHMWMHWLTELQKYDYIPSAKWWVFCSILNEYKFL